MHLLAGTPGPRWTGSRRPSSAASSFRCPGRRSSTSSPWPQYLATVCLCSPLYYEFNKKLELSRYEQQEKARKRIESKKAAKKARNTQEDARLLKDAKEGKAALENGNEIPTKAEIAEEQTPKKEPKKKGTGGSKSRKKKKGKKTR